MKNQVILATLALSLSLIATGPVVFAGPQTPESLALSCIDDMNAKAERCCDSIESKVNRAAPKISALVADGKTSRATSLADRTKKSVRALRQRCDNAITRVRNSCRQKLLDLGETELAAAVQAAKLSAIGSINTCRDNAIDAIDAALAGGT